jgi:predicted dehydrogenase
MRPTDSVGVGIVGTGFMASTHTEALRRLGVDVVGIVGRTKESASTAAEKLSIPTAYSTVDELLDDPSVSAVHVTTPNDLHAEQARAALAAGKHVVCEKPLGVDSGETEALVRLAAESNLVNAVCFNIRFSPHVQNAAGLVRDGAIGTPRFVTGAYLQDWLLLETDWNWRLVSSRQGGLRAVADIGSHWLDLVQFVTGRRVQSVLADLHTFVPERNHPLQEVGTFGAAGVRDDVERVRERMESDDAAGILLRFSDGARGVCSVSQVAAGRKNRLTWEVDGSESALAWTSEDPEYLWIGHRGRPNELVQTDASLMSDLGAQATGFPAGHVEGYPDTFKALFSAVYADIRAGAPPAQPTYPTFADGHDIVLVCEAIAESARTESWTSVDGKRRRNR